MLPVKLDCFRPQQDVSRYDIARIRFWQVVKITASIALLVLPFLLASLVPASYGLFTIVSAGALILAALSLWKPFPQWSSPSSSMSLLDRQIQLAEISLHTQRKIREFERDPGTYRAALNSLGFPDARPPYQRLAELMAWVDRYEGIKSGLREEILTRIRAASGLKDAILQRVTRHFIEERADPLLHAAEKIATLGFPLLLGRLACSVHPMPTWTFSFSTKGLPGPIPMSLTSFTQVVTIPSAQELLHSVE